jgi:hypothetical protein
MPEHCADCHVYGLWRAAYVDRAIQSDQDVLPEMLAAHGLPEIRLSGLNPFHMTGSEWLALIASMIEVAQQEPVAGSAP